MLKSKKAMDPMASYAKAKCQKVSGMSGEKKDGTVLDSGPTELPGVLTTDNGDGAADDIAEPEGTQPSATQGNARKGAHSRRKPQAKRVPRKQKAPARCKSQPRKRAGEQPREHGVPPPVLQHQEAA